MRKLVHCQEQSLNYQYLSLDWCYKDKEKTDITSFLLITKVSPHGDESCNYQIHCFMHCTVYRLLAITRKAARKESVKTEGFYITEYLAAQWRSLFVCFRVRKVVTLFQIRPVLRMKISSEVWNCKEPNLDMVTLFPWGLFEISSVCWIHYEQTLLTFDGYYYVGTKSK